MTAIDRFIQRKKSKYSTEALEDLEVFKIAHEDLENLFKSNPKYEHFGRLFMQQIYMDLVERIDDLQLNTAQERYEILFAKKTLFISKSCRKAYHFVFKYYTRNLK